MRAALAGAGAGVHREARAPDAEAAAVSGVDRRAACGASRQHRRHCCVVPARRGGRRPRQGRGKGAGGHDRIPRAKRRRGAAALGGGRAMRKAAGAWGGGGGLPGGGPLAGTDSTVGKSAAAGGGRLGPPFRRILGTGMAGGAAVRPGRSADGVLRSPQLGKPRGTVPSPSITHTADGGPRQCAVGSAAPGEHRPRLYRTSEPRWATRAAPTGPGTDRARAGCRCSNPRLRADWRRRPTSRTGRGRWGTCPRSALRRQRPSPPVPRASIQTVRARVRGGMRTHARTSPQPHTDR